MLASRCSPLLGPSSSSRLLSYRLVQFPILQVDSPLPGKRLQARGASMGPRLGAKPPALQNLDGTGLSGPRWEGGLVLQLVP